MKKITFAIVSVMMMGLGLIGLVTAPVMARPADEYGFEERDGNHSTSTSTSTSKSCAGVETSIIDCDAGNENGEAVGELLLKAVKIMTGMIAALAVLGVIIAGYQYMMSSGDAAKTAKAKRRLYEIVIGLVVFALMYAALEFLVPGL